MFVAWEDFESGTSYPDIYGRVFFPNGTALGSDFIINQITTNDQQYPSVSGLTNGNVFVAWEDYRSGTTMISMGGSSFLMEQPWGVSLSLIKSQPIISGIRQFRVWPMVMCLWPGMTIDLAPLTLISMGGSSFLMELPWGVSLSLIKSLPVIRAIRQFRFDPMAMCLWPGMTIDLARL